MKFRAPANVLLRRAQLVLILAALVPTVLMTSLGIILLASGVGAIGIVIGSLVLAFCTSALTGFILGSIFMSKGASLARIQNDYLSSVSHELRTPITSLRMFLDTLRQGRVTDPEERDRCLQIMDREMVRLDGLVGRLHELSRIEMSRSPLAPAPVMLDEVAAEALESFRVLSLSAPAHVESSVPKGIQVRGDRAALVLAVVNLLSNAWKYTGPDKRIKLTVQPTGKHVEVCVADNGPGIPDAERARIFEPFERGQAAADTRAQGSGLGLAIVRGIARNHGGKVDVKHTGPTGSELRITLPYKEVPA